MFEWTVWDLSKTIQSLIKKRRQALRFTCVFRIYSADGNGSYNDKKDDALQNKNKSIGFSRKLSIFMADWTSYKNKINCESMLHH